jgi:uncharacterized membrane protein
MYGFERVKQFGLDDVMSWWLLPIFGFTIAATSLNAIVYGLMKPEEWNARFNPSLPLDHACGRTRWATIGAIVLSLMIGTVGLLSGLAYSIQRYFEATIEMIQ